MLDLKTLILLEFCNTSLQTVVWLLVWLTWRRLYELKFIVAGFAMISLGLLLLILRGPEPSDLRIVLDNAVIKLGLVLLADGLACFLGQPRILGLGLALVGFQVISWSVAVYVVPESLATRIHLSTLVTVAIMTMMCRTLVTDRTQPRALRWITIALLVEYMGASIFQSALAELYPASVESAKVLSDVNSWYIFQGALFLLAFFACLLFMVSARLSADLRDRNTALAREVAVRQRLEGELSDSLATEKALRLEQHHLMRMVGHEFRTPLSIIRYATEMLGMLLDKPTDAVAKRLAGIDEASGRMTVLIDRFLTAERQEDGVTEVTRIDFEALLDEVLRHFDHAGRSDRLVFSVARPLPNYWGDTDMLLSVLINLVDNALKYSPEGQDVEATIEAEPEALRISVADRGIGVPVAELAQVGQRFFRASNTQAATGTGLGIYTCRRLLGYHRGTLQIGPRTPCGTIATVRLPLPGISETARGTIEELA
jgi:two-component system, OmpR family, sensor kinase